MKKVITSIISLLTMASLLVGAPKKDIVATAEVEAGFQTPVLLLKPQVLLAHSKEKALYGFCPTDEAFAKLSNVP